MDGLAPPTVSPMAYRLASHLHAVAIDDRAIVLDVAQDRYRLLGPPSGQVVRALLRNDAAHPGFERLVKLGVAEHGVAEQSLPIQSVLASALERPDERHASLGFAEVAGSFARSVIELKLHGMNKTLAGVRSRASVVQPADLPVIPIAQAYVRLRSRVPLKQVCLPDSIGLHRILSARRMLSSLVIGVRLDPFMAHCWVQADAMVLNDSYDHVAAYTPILWI